MTSEKPKIHAILLLEIIGRPAEHLTATLEQLIKEMGEEKGVSVIGKKIIYLNILMFKYMPAHIEVVSPENISMQNNEWSDLLSELVRRLHAYDEVARVLGVEKDILEKRLREIMEQQGKAAPSTKEEKLGKAKKPKKILR